MITRARKTCLALLFASTMVVSFCLAIGPSSAATGIVLQPKIQSPAPTIDGRMSDDTVWTTANYTTLNNLVVNSTNNINLKVMSLIVGSNIYFGLLFETTAHSYNESFALALSDNSTSALGSNPDLYKFNTTKCVRFDRKSWDLTIDQKNRQFSNISAGNNITCAAGIIVPENYTFYEISFSLNSTNQGDINWDHSGSFAMKIFYGNAYGGANKSNYPLIDSSKWSSTPVIKMTINPTSTNPITGAITAGEFNTIVAEVIFFVIGVIIFGGVGVYILGSKNRMRRA